MLLLPQGSSYCILPHTELGNGTHPSVHPNGRWCSSCFQISFLSSHLWFLRLEAPDSMFICHIGCVPALIFFSSITDIDLAFVLRSLMLPSHMLFRCLAWLTGMLGVSGFRIEGAIVWEDGGYCRRMVFRVVYSKRRRYPMALKTTLDREVHVCPMFVRPFCLLWAVQTIGQNRDCFGRTRMQSYQTLICSYSIRQIHFVNVRIRSGLILHTGIQYSIWTVFSARSVLHN